MLSSAFLLHLELDTPDADGNTARQRAVKMKKYGKHDERLDTVIEIPQIALKSYGIFMELNGSRSSSGFGMNPISFTEIKSYVDLHRTRLLSWEINVIKHLDSVFLKFISKKG